MDPATEGGFRVTAQDLPVWTLKIAAEPMVVLADLLCDANPIHLDPHAVAAAGLGDRVINQGPANVGYILNMLTNAFPEHRVARLESRYLANVRAGDDVEAGGTFVEGSNGQIDCSVWLRVREGAIAVAAEVTLKPRQT